MQDKTLVPRELIDDIREVAEEHCGLQLTSAQVESLLDNYPDYMVSAQKYGAYDQSCRDKLAEVLSQDLMGHDAPRIRDFMSDDVLKAYREAASRKGYVLADGAW